MHDYWTLMKKLIWLRILQGASFIVNKITGTSPITLTNAINSAIISLTQYGKCVQDGTSPVSIICNNGTLKWDSVNQRIYADGTPEVVTLSASGVADQTATVENLYAVDDITDEQDIITGKVIRRTEAVVSDGTTPSGRYVGEVGVGNIIVKARETGYSGEIVSFTTEEGTPLNGLRVNLEPNQDLHGYDNPWPAGGGKNKLNPKLYSGGSYNPPVGSIFNLTESATQFTTTDNKIFSLTTSATWRNFTIVIPCAGIDAARFSYQFSSTGQGGRSWGYLDDNYTVLSVTNSTDASASYDVQWNPSSFEGAAYVYLVITNRGTASATLTLTNPQFERGSTKTSYAPYSNICPISGHTSADVTRTGKNLLYGTEYGGSLYNVNSGTDLTATPQTYASYTESGNEITVDAVYGFYSVLFVTDVLPQGKYHIHCDAPILTQSATPRSTIYITDKDLVTDGSAFRNWATLDPLDVTITLTKSSRIAFSFATNTAGSQAVLKNLQIEYGEVYTEWGAYSGTTYPIPLGTTVYGGTLDVLTGVLTVTHKVADMGQINFDKSSATSSVGGSVFIRALQNVGDGMAPRERYTPIDAQSEVFAKCTEATWYVSLMPDNSFFYSDSALCFAASAYSTAAEFKTAMSGVQFVYPLATPTTIQLTPQQVELLQGENNIWSDANSINVYVPSGEVVEQVTPQKLKTAEGTNVVEVTSNVDPVTLEVEYKINR